MSSPPHFVVHSERLTRIFGRWPSFHDAEVTEAHLSRGEPVMEGALSGSPTLTVKVHLWQGTKEIDAQGSYVRRKHTLATLRFHELEEDSELSGFNHQNVLFDLQMTTREREGGGPPVIDVDFQSSFGLSAAFGCERVEVVDAQPCDERGRPMGR